MNLRIAIIWLGMLIIAGCATSPKQGTRGAEWLALNTRTLQLYESGALDEALTSARQSLEIARTFRPAENADLATSLHNLGIVQTARGVYDEAESALREALRLREQLLGPNHSETATSLAGLGTLLAARGNDAAAEDLLLRALEIWGRGGSLPPAASEAMATVAEIYRRKGLRTEAVEMMRKAVDARQKALGLQDHLLARLLLRLARVNLDAGRLEDALVAARRAEDIARDVDQRLYAQALAMNGEVALAHKKFSEAESALSHALAILQGLGPSALGPLSDALLAQGQLLLATNRPGPAAEAFKRALDIRERILPPNHLDIAVAAGFVGQAAYAAGNLQQAMELFTEALTISRKTLGPDDLDIAQILFNLGVVHRRLGNLERAETMLSQALEIRQKRLGDRHSLTIQAMESLARTLEERGDAARATYLRERLEMLRPPQ